MAFMNEAAMAALEAERRKNERLYKKLLMRCVGEMDRLVAGVDDPSKIVALIRQYAETKAFQELMERAVSRMITAVGSAEKSTWRQAAIASTKGKVIYAALRDEVHNTAIGPAINEIVANNSLLIKTVPRDIAAKFAAYAQRMQMKGVRPADIAREMQKKAPQLAAYQVRRIARTETAKAASALMQARCNEIGCEWYIWHTCEDERVRTSHSQMEGVLCRWSDPPNPEALFPMKGVKAHGPYHPGGIYNCRCIALPVIGPEDLSFPCKAHVHGKIVMIGSLKEFNRLSAA